MKVAIYPLTAIALLGLPTLAYSHEGESHSAPQVAEVVLPEQGWHAVAAQSEQFEVVVKYPSQNAGNLPLRVFLSDFATNEPIGGATVTVRLTTMSGGDVAAATTPTKGIYEAEIPSVPDGEHELILTISAGERQDLLLAGGVRIGGTAPPRPAVSAHGAWAGYASLVVIGLSLAGVALAWRRRRQKPVAVADPARMAAHGLLLGILSVAVLLNPARLRAHGGESHGDEDVATAAPAPAGATLRVAKESQFLLGIRTQLAEQRAVAKRLSALGRIIAVPENEAEVYPPQPGLILPPSSGRIRRIGDVVEVGQTLLFVEQVLSAPERIQLQSERYRVDAEFRAAKERLAQARRDAERARSLEGVLATKDIQQAELALKLAEEDATRTANQQRLFDSAAGGVEGLKRFAINAPISGVVTEVHASAGEQIEPGRLLYKIADLSTVWMDVHIFEENLTAVSAARRAAIHSRANPERMFEGTLVTLGQVVDQATRTVQAVFAIPNPEGLLRVGMTAEASLETGTTAEAVVIPAEALFDEGGRSVVLVHTSPEEFALREVNVADRGPDWVALASGIDPGERVVTSGAYQLKTAARKG